MNLIFIRDKAIIWSLMWIFPAAISDSAKPVGALQHSINENLSMNEILLKFFTGRRSDHSLKKKIEAYNLASDNGKDLSNFEIYMKKVDSSAKKPLYFKIELDQKLSQVLEGLLLIEFPEFILEIKSNLSCSYSIISKENLRRITEEEEDNDGKSFERTPEDDEEEGEFLSDSSALDFEIHQDPEISNHESLILLDEEEEEEGNPAENITVESIISSDDIEEGEYIA